MMNSRSMFVNQKTLCRIPRLVACAAVWIALIQTASAQPPQITVQPQSQNVSIGDPASFHVEAVGTPPIFFQWKRNGVNIPGATNVSVQVPATDDYSIQSVQLADAGNYNVVVFNRDGATDSGSAVLIITNFPVLPFGDDFANRGSIADFLGSARGSNFNASGESGEPFHGKKPGGASVWLKWTAPFSGIATFDTRGSTFDTTLGVYTGAGLASLVSVAQDDDRGGYLNSYVTFNVQKDTSYDIAVDGFYADQGYIVLNLAAENTQDFLPEIVTQPAGKTLPPNSPITLSVQVASNTPPSVSFQWRFNESDIQGETKSFLSIPALTPARVGRYSVQVFLLDQSRPRTNMSDTAELQINVQDGASNGSAGAQPKFREAADPDFLPRLPFRGGGKSAAPAGGFTGTQIFSTSGASKEPGEPNHCGEAGGASYWFSYQAPATGTLNVDTAGTTFNNVLAVYTGPNPILNFTDLVSVACSSVSAVPGNESVVFAATSNSIYYLVSDGVGGAMGTVNLNYSLAAAPVITTQPTNQTVSAGANPVFIVGTTGTPVLNYQWRFNSTDIANATSSSFAVTNAQATNAGSYTVVVTNGAGSVTSAVATLTVNGPPFITTQPTNQTVVISNDATFIVAAIGPPTPRYQWRFNATNNLAGATNAMLTVTNALTANAGSYTALATNSFGSVTSSVATLTVHVPPSISSHPQSQTVAPGSNVTLTVVASGTPSPDYRWRKNGVGATSRTNASTTITNFQSSDEAGYDVVVTNVVGAVTSSTATLYLNSPLRFTNLTRQLNVHFTSLLIGAANTNYVIDYSEDTTNWFPIRTNSSATGLINFSDTNVLGHPQRIYRASPR